MRERGLPEDAARMAAFEEHLREIAPEAEPGGAAVAVPGWV
jgi:hypothetical protein